MKVAVLGCGSLGGVMSGRLAGNPDLELTVIDRDPRISAAIASKGLLLRCGNKQWRRPVHVVQEAGEERFDALILATKATSLGAAAKDFEAHLSPEAPVVTVQNGLVALDLAQVIGTQRLVPGCVLWGASMEAPGEYRITNSGPFIVGSLEDSVRPPAVNAAEELLSRIFPTTISSNIRGVLWSKLAITTTFTTLGAITGQPFGRLSANRQIRSLILSIGAELYRVARAEGIRFESLGAGLDIERFLSEHGYPRLLKNLMIRIIGHKNREDESSMLASLRQETKTEIEFINGRVVEAAQRHGLEVPYNRLAVQLIHRMENGELKPSPEHLDAFHHVA